MKQIMEDYGLAIVDLMLAGFFCSAFGFLLNAFCCC